MYNYLSELSYYKGKSVMIIETSIGVSYGKASPFVRFKFAPRNDYKSPGQWSDENVYWITSYVDLCLFVKGITEVAAGKQQKYEMKNPKKGVTLSIYLSKNDNDGTEYINFSFYKGDTKIHASLVKTTEFYALYTYFKNLVDSYNVVAQTALMKYDIWYEFVGKKKQGQNNNSNNRNRPQNNRNNAGGNNNYSGNQGYQPNNNAQMNDAMSSMEAEIDSSQNSFDFDGSDVPF